MKRMMLAAVIMATFCTTTFGQEDAEAMKFANTITKIDLHRHLSIIASDALQGRETGKVGQKMAAAYIAEQFKALDLQGPVKGGANAGYYQNIILYSSVPGEIFLTIKKEKYNNFEGIIYYGSAITNGTISKEIAFVGAGMSSDFESHNVKDKAVMIMSETMGGWREAVKLAKEKGAKMIFIVNTPTDEAFTGMEEQFKGYLMGGSLALNKPESGSTDGVFFIKPSLAGQIFNTKTEKLKEAIESKKSIKPAKINYSIGMHLSEVQTENVLGFLEGTDKKDEVLVLTSHYDHLGMNGEDIYNGADDDGSGTVALLEIAQAFSEAKKASKGPRRSILFMTVTGEEKGLLGSEYYTINPIFPLKNTIADLNIDMIGRIDNDHKEGDSYVSLVGSDKLSSELHEISETANTNYTKLDLDYTYNDENHPERIYYRSDHWNFAKNNIPVIFYTTGTHPDYHKPTDTVEKIEFDLLTKRAQLVFYTAWVLANREQRIVVDKQ
jgi:hypothetical protein